MNLKEEKSQVENFNLVILLSKDPERAWNALRIVLGLLLEGEKVKIFLTGEGVEVPDIEHPKFNVKELLKKILDRGGEFFT